MNVYLIIKRFILFQIKKNVISVQMNVSHYAKMVESLNAEIEKLKLKLKMHESENGSREGVAPPAAPPSTLPSCKDKLSAPYQELEAMTKEISKLAKEIKLLNWRNHVKKKIAARLPCLSTNAVQLAKVTL
jgi:predicted  nucleic acid-binding Zn-ribbon protein